MFAETQTWNSLHQNLRIGLKPPKALVFGLAEVVPAVEWVANQVRWHSQDAENQIEIKLELQPEQVEASVLE